MPSFKDFANEGVDNGFPMESTSIRYRQKRDNKVGSRIEKVWATDYERCKSREDFEKYISKYGKYDANKYVEQARARIESFETIENARAEREKNAQKIQQRPVAPVTGGSDIHPQKRFIQPFIKVAVWVVIIVGVGFYSYNQYKQEEKEKKTDVVIIPQPNQHQQQPEEYTTHSHSEQLHEQESQVVEPEPEPQEFWWDCNICGTTGRCQLCFGSGRCGVCGGGGLMFSVFYGDEVGPGRLTDCVNCGGSGRCPSCEGSGVCFACHGIGKCKLED